MTPFFELEATMAAGKSEWKREQQWHESWWELTSESLYGVFPTLISWSNENKSCMRVDESWQARVCSRVFPTVISWSNENKCCTRVDESWQERVCMRVFSTLMSWSNENKSCMRVDKREFVWEFSQLSCPGQTRTRVAWELMRVDESWQERVCMRVLSTTLNAFNFLLQEQKERGRLKKCRT